MEGASQLQGVREIWGCLPEYWQTGKPRLEDDVAAACEGLLAAGTSDLVVLDNHGGNTVNVSAEALPAGARLETWRDFDLLDHGVYATFQLGYHPRGGVDAALVPFLPYWLGAFDSAKDAAAADQQRVGELQLIFDAWAAESHPQWYAAAADPLPAGVTEQLSQA